MQSGFNDSVWGLQCDHKPMVRRRGLDSCQPQAYLTRKLRERDLGRDLEGAKITALADSVADHKAITPAGRKQASGAATVPSDNHANSLDQAPSGKGDTILSKARQSPRVAAATCAAMEASTPTNTAWPVPQLGGELPASFG
jgi:hypothetical protein